MFPHARLPELPPPTPPPVWRIRDFVWAQLGALAGGFVGVAIMLPLSGIEVDLDATTGAGDLASVDIDADLLFTVGLPAQLIAQALVVWLLARHRGLTLQAALGFDLDLRDLWYVPLGAVLSVAVAFATFPFTEWLGVDESPQGSVQLLQDLSGGFPLLMALIGVAIATPIVEELVFRGILQRALGARWGRRATISTTALVFAAFHLTDVSGDNIAGKAITILVPISLIGLVLSYVVDRDRRLGRAIAVHSGVNLTSLVLVLAGFG